MVICWLKSKVKFLFDIPNFSKVKRIILGACVGQFLNLCDEARLDFAGKSFWQPCEMAFFDVNVFSPFAKSHLKTNLDTLFK